MKIIIFILLFTLSFSSTAFAGGRSSAGGGELQKFDTGKWATATGVGFGSAMVGGAIGNFIKPVQGYNSFSNWSNTYSASLAGGQVGRAIGTAGSYYGWDPKMTIITSSIGSGMAGGALNPGQFGTAGGANIVTSPGKAMMLGGLSGGIQGGIVAASTKNGKTPIWAGPVGGLAGNFATTYVVSGFSKPVMEAKTVYADNLPDDVVWAPLLPRPTKTVMEDTGKINFSFNNKFDSAKAFEKAWKGAVVAVPSYAMQMGIENIASHNENNASIIRQASSGLYPIVGAVSSNTLGKMLGDGQNSQQIGPNNFSNTQGVVSPNINTNPGQVYHNVTPINTQP